MFLSVPCRMHARRADAQKGTQAAQGRSADLPRRLASPKFLEEIMKKIVTGLMILAAFGLFCGTAVAKESAPAQVIDKAQGVATQAEAGAKAADAVAAGSEATSVSDQAMQIGKEAMNAAKDKAVEQIKGKVMDSAKDKMMGDAKDKMMGDAKDKMMGKAKDALNLGKTEAKDSAAEGVEKAVDGIKK